MSTGPGVFYEVNLDVEGAIATEYLGWLQRHVEQVLALRGFVSAQVFDVLDPVRDGLVSICVHYRLRDATALEAYLRDHAPRMRADGVARFGARFSATRRVLRAA